MQIVLSDSALGFIIDKGYNETYGARELERTFERLVTEPLSQKILKRDVKSGQIQVSERLGQIHFENFI